MSYTLDLESDYIKITGVPPELKKDLYAMAQDEDGTKHLGPYLRKILRRVVREYKEKEAKRK